MREKLAAAGLREAAALGEQANTPETWFRALAAGWLGYLASQGTHLVVRRSPPG